MSEPVSTRIINAAVRYYEQITGYGPVVGVAGGLVALAVVYFSYAFISERAAPCESVFRQTSVGLSTKINFLEAQGVLQIGREPLVDLTERAQMTALNLKTCCTVLDAGKLDPEQFLQCKSKARAYDSEVDSIVDLVKQAIAAQTTPTKAAITETGSVTPAPKIAVVQAQVQQHVAAARTVSQSFNKQVVQVRKAQALETLELVPPKHVDVSAQEREPNNDSLNTNVITPENWIQASVGAKGDLDYFTFTTPPKYRDWIRIEVDNRSTTLEPRIELFDAEKTSLGTRHKKTPGAAVSYYFVSQPETQYTFRVSSYYGESVGGYLVRVVGTKSYDTHEPNDTILRAREISAGTDYEAGMMDGKDADFFKVTAPSSAKQMEIKVANRSTTLRPYVITFDRNKSKVGSHYNKTGGGDLGFTFDVTPENAYYLRVGDYYGDAAGDYTIAVTFKP